MKLNVLPILAILFFACQQPANNNAVSQVNTSPNSVSDTIVQKNDNQNTKYDLSNFVVDSTFKNNGVLFTLFRDTTEKRCISIVVERNKNNQRDTILEFTAKKEFGYYIRDIDGDENLDIVIAQDPLRSFGYYFYNPLADNFIDNNHWYPVWKRIGNGICYDMPESLKGPFFSSNLVVIKNGLIRGLAYLKIEPDEEDETTDKPETNDINSYSFFNKPPKATLIKIKNGNFDNVEWQEDIKPEIIKKYFTKGNDNYEGFFKEIWENNYKRF